MTDYEGPGAMVRRVGLLLLDATGAEHDEILRALRNYLSHTEIAAALAVAKGELDESLLYRGVPTHKILGLSRDDQQRLVSGEKLGLLTTDGRIEFISWAEMTPTQRNQMIGQGVIIKPSDQYLAGS